MWNDNWGRTNFQNVQPSNIAIKWYNNVARFAMRHCLGHPVHPVTHEHPTRASFDVILVWLLDSLCVNNKD